MPRLRYIEESEQTPYTRELIESAKRTGAPDPRVVSLMTRSQLGIAWVEYWNKLLYQGILPHKLKEMCRIKISVAHRCGYCSTVRSIVAKADGLTEDMINDLVDYAGSKRFCEREKAALHYCGSVQTGRTLHRQRRGLYRSCPVLRRGRRRRQVRQVAQRAELGGGLRTQSQAQCTRATGRGGVKLRRDALVEGLETVLWPQKRV
jgi:AhpD family alkylhydroperoxidase